MASVINKILAPTDFTEYGNAAVETAAGFAKAFDAKLVLLHVVDIPSYSSILFDENPKPDQMAHDFAIEQLKLIQDDPLMKELDVEICVEAGKIFHCIVQKAEETNTDLIVMGAHGLSGFEHLVLGTNARRVIHLSSAPVLTVKEPIDIEKVRNIAFASSFNQEYAYSFPRMYQYIEMFKTRVNLVKVITPKDFESTALSKKTIDDFASSLNLSEYHTHIVNEDSIEEGLSWFCEQEKIDLLFMLTHVVKGQGLLHRSFAERMGQFYAVPVFSLKMIEIKQTHGVIFPD